MASKYDKNGIIQFLQTQEEIDPSRYDGSYELLKETVKAYASLGDYSTLNYLDLNLVYLMVVISNRHSVEKKKETVRSSHLADTEKNRLIGLLDRIWEKTQKGEYEKRELNAESAEPILGMFGTGFYSFQNKTTDKCSRDFIRMCVDILNTADDEAMFDRADQVLNDDFKGMKAASASVVLHCLKPMTFPILNGNSGFDNIFEALGIRIKKKGELSTYIANCRLIKSYRDSHFDFKNYRVFDVAARNLDKYLLEAKKTYKIDVDKLKAEIAGYKADFDRIKKEENYKWEAIKCFQDHFDLEASDFASMMERALEKEGNLLSRQNFFARRIILELSRKYPEDVREMFRNLYDESLPLLERLQQFEDTAEILYFQDHDRSLSTYQDEKASTVYLFFRYPDKHYIYLSMKYENAAKQIGYGNIPKHGSVERILAYYDMADQVYQYIQTDNELIRMNRSRLTDDCYQDPKNHVLVEDIIYFLKRTYTQSHQSEERENDEYFPSLDDYNPGLTADKYQEVFSDDRYISKSWLDTIYYLYKMGGEGTCKQIAGRFGNHPSRYINHANTVAKKVIEATDCPVMLRNTSNSRYWPVLFFGKYTSGEEGVYIWKLREPVREAMRSMEQNGFFEQMESDVEYPKNMILYGPPGTGKTYHTMIYAVAIIEGRELEDVKEEAASDYDALKARYDMYMKKEQIAFTTFHQSYGYEEFIEGIKPLMDEDDEDQSEIKYHIKQGVFKMFCEKAMTPVSEDADRPSFGLNSTPVIWKVSLDGTGDNPVREECMENGHIRIGWDGYGEQITDETDFTKYKGRVVLNAFINKMRIGDIVLSCYSASEIDAIGVVTGEYEWHPEYDRLKRLRKVNWLVKGLRHNIVDINGDTTMTLATVYKLNVSLSDVMQVLDQNMTANTLAPVYSTNKNRYVFIVDEINRGNISKIFGELITLVESSKRLGQREETRLTLPYSGKEFGIPGNVYIIGTMNTADRSIALMDTALRRRFQFVPMMPEPEALSDIEDIDGINVAEMLRTMNKRIEVLVDREHTIGHSYFWELKSTPTLDCLARIFENSIIPLLQEYFYDDYEKICLVLGDNQKPKELQFISRQGIDKADLFGATDSDVDTEALYIIHNDVIRKRAESYVGIYQRVAAQTDDTDISD